jgi:hypothetical protein
LATDSEEAEVGAVDLLYIGEIWFTFLDKCADAMVEMCFLVKSAKGKMLSLVQKT